MTEEFNLGDWIADDWCDAIGTDKVKIFINKLKELNISMLEFGKASSLNQAIDKLAGEKLNEH